jgi:hypothetical protein
MLAEFNANADFFAGHKVASNQMPGQKFFNYSPPLTTT